MSYLHLEDFYSFLKSFHNKAICRRRKSWTPPASGGVLYLFWLLCLWWLLYIKTDIAQKEKDALVTVNFIWKEMCLDSQHYLGNNVNIRRLKKYRPDLLDKVEKGELSYNKAMIIGGLKKRKAEFNPDSLLDLILALAAIMLGNKCFQRKLSSMHR